MVIAKEINNLLIVIAAVIPVVKNAEKKVMMTIYPLPNTDESAPSTSRLSKICHSRVDTVEAKVKILLVVKGEDNESDEPTVTKVQLGENAASDAYSGKVLWLLLGGG